MESVVDISVESCERNIKFDRKYVRGQAAWVVFNFSILIFDWHTFMTSPSNFSSFGFGAMAITTLWSTMFFLESWRELRDEKLRLKFLTELKDTHFSSMERQQYVEVKNHYERLIEQLKEKNNEPT